MRSIRPTPPARARRTTSACRVALIALGLLATAAPPVGIAATTPAPTSGTAPLGAAPVIAPDIASFTLPNGMTVVVIPDHRAPVVTHMVWYKVGAADETPGKSGIAHYLEHLMFKGTKANPDGAFSKKVAEIGGQENAFTSSDYTAYFQRVAKEHLGLVMGLEADRMAGLVLTEQVALPERKVILEERSQRIDNEPGAQLAEALDNTLYMASPYRIPVIGWRHEMEQLTYRDALDFYGKWYTPNNAILVVAGDVTLDDVRPLAEATYGKVARRFEVAPRVRPTEPEPVARREVTLADERITQPSLRLAWLVPSSRTAKAGESEALDVLCEAVGGGPASRLYRTVVVEKKLASSVGCSYQTTAYDDTKLTVYAAPLEKVDLAGLRTTVDGILAEVARDGLTEEEVTRAKRRLIARAVHAQDNQSTLARIFGAALASGETLESVQTWPSRVLAVDGKTAQALAERYLKPERQVAGFLVPAAPGSGPARTARGAGMPFGDLSQPIRAITPVRTPTEFVE
jgi:zinc protease